MIQEYTQYSSLTNVRIPQAPEYITLAAKVLTKNSGLDIFLNTTTARYLVEPYHYSVKENGTALLVWLATGWTFRSSNTGGREIFRTRLDRPWGSTSLIYNGHWISFNAIKPMGREVDHKFQPNVVVKKK